jgi:hypothetical protein
MGAVVSCVSAGSPKSSSLKTDQSYQITGMLRAIGSGLMVIVNGVAAILKGIINAIASFFDVLISCLTCGGGDVRSRHTTTAV